MSAPLECASCAARAGEAVFPCKKRGELRLCADCLAEAATPKDKAATPIMRRAAYRSALRIRQMSPQLDLVDMVVATP